MLFSYHKPPDRPDGEDVEDVIDDDYRPWGADAGAKLLLPDQVHPPRNDVRAVLPVMREQQNLKYPHAMVRIFKPSGEPHDSTRPNQSVDGAIWATVKLLLIEGHPIVLEDVIADEMADECEEERGGVHKK